MILKGKTRTGMLQRHTENVVSHGKQTLIVQKYQSFVLHVWLIMMIQFRPYFFATG